MILTCLRTSRARLSSTCCSSISSCCARWISRVAPIAPSCGVPERSNQPTDILLNFAIHRGTKNQRRRYRMLYRYMRPATCNGTLWYNIHYIFSKPDLFELSQNLYIQSQNSYQFTINPTKVVSKRKAQLHYLGQHTFLIWRCSVWEVATKSTLNRWKMWCKISVSQKKVPINSAKAGDDPWTEKILN
jgi:hypothetical protein